MNSGRIQEIQESCGFPQSHSVQLALLQVWNEVAQEKDARIAELESARASDAARIADLEAMLREAGEKTKGETVDICWKLICAHGATNVGYWDMMHAVGLMGEGPSRWEKTGLLPKEKE